MRLSDLADEAYVDRLSCEMREMVMEVCRSRRINLYARFRSEREDWVQAMVLARIGFAFMPECAVVLPELLQRPLIEPEVARTISLVSAPGRPYSPANRRPGGGGAALRMAGLGQRRFGPATGNSPTVPPYTARKYVPEGPVCTCPMHSFLKMNGLGNEIIVADMRGRADRVSPQAAVVLNADPATRFDQVMALHDPRTPGTFGYIEIINSDGTLAEACGNGMRCVVQALSAETGQKSFVFETLAGILTGDEHADGSITVDMGKPRMGWQDIPLAEEFYDTTGIELQIGPIDAPVLHTPSAVSMGNPHVTFWVDTDVWSYALDRFGPLLENHPLFPSGATSRSPRWSRPSTSSCAPGSAAPG